MRGLFNATCWICGIFKPRCAAILLRGGAGRDSADVTGAARDVCEDCRKDIRGRYRLTERHKGNAHAR
jgi:hypothetical protein